jgi:MoxR-like ATPase
MATFALNHDLLSQRLEPASVAPRVSRDGKATRRPYLPDDGLEDAAALAIILGQPLLLAGSPGVGKTGAAYHVAAQMELDTPPRFTVNSGTAGRDLLYRFDALARFYDASVAGKGEGLRRDRADRDPVTGLLAERRFLRLEALGRAIAQAAGGNALVYDAATNKPLAARERIAAITGKEPAGEPELRVRDLFPAGTTWLKDDPDASLVLIDEIDKAQREAANDLLESFEAMRFTIDELGIVIAAEYGSADEGVRRQARPVVVVTTNSEQNLPDAFIRRCVFHYIPPPGETRLIEIVSEHLKTTDGQSSGQATATAGVAVSIGLTISKKVRAKPPGTAEYIALARAISRFGLVDAFRDRTAGDTPVTRSILGTLVKTLDDLNMAVEAVTS